jgi:drug/metabolite transporter (DMT)-like permease
MAAPSRGMNIAAWVASALLFVLYTVIASPPKLMSNPQAVEGFLKYGYSDGFRLFIGSCEFLGGIALLIPRLAFWSACGLFIIMIGAVHAHLTHDEASHLPPVLVAMVLLAFIAYVRRGQALFLS